MPEQKKNNNPRISLWYSEDGDGKNYESSGNVRFTQGQLTQLLSDFETHGEMDSYLKEKVLNVKIFFYPNERKEKPAQPDSTGSLAVDLLDK